MTTGEALAWVVILLPIYFVLVIVTTTQENAMDFIRTAAKAVAAVAVSALAPLAAKYGLDVDVDAMTLVVTSFLTGVAVYFTRNKAPEA